MPATMLKKGNNMFFNKKKTDEQLYDLCTFHKETFKNGNSIVYVYPNIEKMSYDDIKRTRDLMDRIFDVNRVRC
jgi:hypothetical protein